MSFSFHHTDTVLSSHLYTSQLGDTATVIYNSSATWLVTAGSCRPYLDPSYSVPGASKLAHLSSGLVPVHACQTESRGGNESVSFEKCWQDASVHGVIPPALPS